MFKSIKRWFVNLALGYAKDVVTVERISAWTVDGANLLLKKATAGIEPEKMAAICETCGKASALCGTLATALADRVVTPEEAEAILADIRALFSTSELTDAKIGALIDRLGAEIKERI